MRQSLPPASQPLRTATSALAIVQQRLLLHFPPLLTLSNHLYYFENFCDELNIYPHPLALHHSQPLSCIYAPTLTCTYPRHPFLSQYTTKQSLTPPYTHNTAHPRPTPPLYSHAAEHHRKPLSPATTKEKILTDPRDIHM